MGLFIEMPWLAILPAIAFLLMYVGAKRPLLLVTSLAWLVYAAYEYGMKLRILCSGECNIRIDLLLLYPVLAIMSIAGIIGLLLARRSPPK